MLDNIVDIRIITVNYKGKNIPLPFIIVKENNVYVAWCPILDIATQGDTKKELEEYIQDLLRCYFEDPDTKKPSLKKDEIVYKFVLIDDENKVKKNAKIKASTR